MRWPILLPGVVAISLIAVIGSRAAPPATTMATIADSPEAGAIRQKLLEWDRSFPKISLQDLRKTYHTDNEREAVYFDWVAHENWEEGKTEQAIRDKFGVETEAQFAHLLEGTTQEDDQVCEIKVDGDRATVNWDIKGVTALPMVKIDGQWLVDGHAMFEGYLKENPNLDAEKGSTIKLMKQATADIAGDKFDDGETFIKDFQNKLRSPGDGN